MCLIEELNPPIMGHKGTSQKDKNEPVSVLDFYFQFVFDLYQRYLRGNIYIATLAL